MVKLTIIYSNNKSPQLKAAELTGFQKYGFAIVEITAEEFLAQKPQTDVLWPYFRDIPEEKEDILSAIANDSRYEHTTIINDYREYTTVAPADKGASYIFAEEHLGLKTPLTYTVRHISGIADALRRLSFPLILKGYPSGQGSDVHLCKNVFSVYYYYFLKKLAGKSVLLQEVIHSSLGTDLRVLLVGREIIFAIKRDAQKDFRANIALGATFTAYELNEEQKRAVMKIGSRNYFDIVGIDFLFAENGELIFNEFNVAPALFTFSESTAKALYALYKNKTTRT